MIYYVIPLWSQGSIYNIPAVIHTNICTWWGKGYTHPHINLGYIFQSNKLQKYLVFRMGCKIQNTQLNSNFR